MLISNAYAQTAAAAGPMDGIMQYLPFIFMFAIIYFMMIRPQQKKAKEHKALIEALGKGESVTLVGFGTFSVGERAARVGRNPQTGAEIQIAASKQPKFSAGSKLKDAVN